MLRPTGLPWVLACTALAPLASGQALPGATDLSGVAAGHGASGPLAALAQQAYFKASNTETNDAFGLAVALDGDTLVVGAPYEDSISTGVDGDQENSGAFDAGAAYVFLRDGTSWTQQAYLKASNTNFMDTFGAVVAISGDTIVVGAPGEDSNATGVDGNDLNNTSVDAGAAYVFVRTGMTWSQQAYLKASNTGADDEFGRRVAICGDTIVVGTTTEDGSAAGVNGVQDDASSGAGAAYVFVRTGTSWSQQAYLKASNTGAGDGFGRSVSVSGDTVVVGAAGEDSSATGVDGDQGDDTAGSSGAAYVFVRSGATWSQQAYLKASNTGNSDNFGSAVSLSGDLLAVAAHLEDSLSVGVNGNQTNNAATNSGAAYVFVRDGTSWSQQAYLKASNTDAGDQFGESIATSVDRVVVGTIFEAGPGDNFPQAGAAYAFRRQGTSWSQQALLQPGNSEAGDRFGRSVAVSGHTIAVGASSEDSSATGVDGDGDDDGAIDSGAAYAYRDPALEPWTNLAGGTSGIAGIPHLEMIGTLEPSSTLTLDLDDGPPPGSLAIVFLAFSSLPAGFLGGVLHAFPYSELVLLPTDFTSGLFGQVSFPGAPSGTGLWFQVGLVDASVPIYGASLSNGVRGLVP